MKFKLRHYQAMREIAFSEDEAKAYLLKKTGLDEFRTLENEIEAYRQYLKLERS